PQRDGPLPISLMRGTPLPANADSDAGPLLQLVSPLTDAHRIGEQVRYRRRYRGEVALEDRRQAQQGRLHIDVRLQRAWEDKPIDTGAALQKRQHLAGALEHDPAAAFLDERGVADELDGVSQALLG